MVYWPAGTGISYYRTHVGQVNALRTTLLIAGLLSFSVWAAAAYPQVITYEANLVFPEDHQTPWERVGTFDADRSLDQGWLTIDVDLGIWEPLPGGEQDAYKRWISEFAGRPFFLEWRCVSDAPNTEIPGVGGSGINAVGGPVANHFTITEDRVQIWRGNSVPLMFVDIQPGVPHTYRVETRPDRQYVYYIDGEIVDSGELLSDFPLPGARIIWGSKMAMTESSNAWDYVRYGVIPADGSGDYNSDGQVDGNDFYFFQECLANGAPGVDAGPGCRWADMDQDSDVDFHDFALFQRAFSGSE